MIRVMVMFKHHNDDGEFYQTAYNQRFALLDFEQSLDVSDYPPRPPHPWPGERRPS